MNKIPITRNDLLRYNEEVITEIRTRVSGTRFRAQDSDPIRIRYLQTLIQALKCANDILKDNDLEEIKERLDLIEQGQAVKE